MRDKYLIDKKYAMVKRVMTTEQFMRNYKNLAYFNVFVDEATMINPIDISGALLCKQGKLYSFGDAM